jgi:hypothetical protein
MGRCSIAEARLKHRENLPIADLGMTTRMQESGQADQDRSSEMLDNDAAIIGALVVAVVLVAFLAYSVIRSSVSDVPH